jgi:ureidoacrylate peracid hydrolase
MELADRIPDRVTELADQIEPGHTALVLVDLQNDFAHDDGLFVKQWHKTNRWIKPIIPCCQRLLAAARGAGITVVHLRIINDILKNPVSWHNFWGPPSCVIEGTWGAQSVDEAMPIDGEIAITKYT